MKTLGLLCLWVMGFSRAAQKQVHRGPSGKFLNSSPETDRDNPELVAIETCVPTLTCNPNNLQFYGLYLLIKGYLLLNCRLLEPQVSPKP